nr:60S ribosomal protein L26 [Paratrimastix eleionoma]
MVKLVKASGSRRKCRKEHFSASSSERRIDMACHLSKELRQKYGVRALPVRKDDEIRIVRGNKKNVKGVIGKVSQIYRKKWVIRIDRLQKDKANGQTVFIGVHPSNCEIRGFKLLADRKNLIERIKAGRSKDAEKGKITEVESVD